MSKRCDECPNRTACDQADACLHQSAKRCNRCHRSMKGTTAYDGACECGGMIEAVPTTTACMLSSELMEIVRAETWPVRIPLGTLSCKDF